MLIFDKRLPFVNFFPWKRFGYAYMVEYEYFGKSSKTGPFWTLPLTIVVSLGTFQDLSYFMNVTGLWVLIILTTVINRKLMIMRKLVRTIDSRTALFVLRMPKCAVFVPSSILPSVLLYQNIALLYWANLCICTRGQVAASSLWDKSLRVYYLQNKGHVTRSNFSCNLHRNDDE